MDTDLRSRIDPFAWEARVFPGLEPRLLAGVPGPGRHVSLAEHRLRHPVPPNAGGATGPRIISEVQRAGLTGRGGADFPTAHKLRAVAAGRKPVIVVNGAEGEPAAGKDAMIMERQPHLIIDGALWAAAAVGADQVFVCVGSHAPQAVAAIGSALAERRRSERSKIKVEVREVPDRYVAGESSALVAMLNGADAVPVSSPPRTSERGYNNRPTLVQNAETLAHLALIMARGAAWYRTAGTHEEPGTRLVSVTGTVPVPTICEVEAGTSLADIASACGADLDDASGVLVGGYYGSWLSTEDASTATLSRSSLEALGASPGCGILHFLPPDACGLKAVADVAQWFAGESAGQCGPCVFGLTDVAAGLRDVARSVGNVDETLHKLDRWTSQLPGRGGCHLPDGASAMVRSGMDAFAHEVRAHRNGFCVARDLAGAVA